MIPEQFVVDYQRAVQPSVGVGRGLMDSDAAVRYSADPDSHEPIGFPLPGLDAATQHLPRFAAADYLRDRGRDEEADTVQTHKGPLIVHEGKVKAAVTDPQHVLDAAHPIERHLLDWSNYSHAHPYIAFDHPDYEHHFDGDPHPDFIRVSHGRGEIDSEEPAPFEDLEHEEVHRSELPQRLAEIIEDHADQQHRYNWGPRTQDDFYTVQADDERYSLEDLLDNLGVKFKRSDRLGMRRPQHPLGNLLDWVWSDEGGTDDAHSTANTLKDLAVSLRDDELHHDDLKDEYGIDLDPDRELTHKELADKRVELAESAEDLAQRFTDLGDGPEKREKENIEHFKKLLEEFKQKAPILLPQHR